LFKTNKRHHGEAPWGGGPEAIAPVAPSPNPVLAPRRRCVSTNLSKVQIAKTNRIRAVQCSMS